MTTEVLKQIWPEWEIEGKPLGKGSFGVVYKAVRRDHNVESYAAIKVISIPTDSSEIDSLRSEGLDINATKTYLNGIVDDFVSEIQLMESLKGVQNIVSVEDYKVVEKTDEVGWDIYIRMELLTPLNTYICDKNLTENDVIKLGCDICTALEICSQRNIIHRDIKPENIFVNDFGYYKLGDFGIARKMESLTGGLSQKGTFNYMAPEVANSGNYDARVDTYSLGIVLYRLLNNNKLPFLDTEKQLLNPNERKNAVERRIRGEALPAPCNASPSMANLILRACAYEPNARFGSATEMKQALTDVANGTYVFVDTGLDKTTSVRSVQTNYDATLAINNGTGTVGYNAQPVVNTFGNAPKQKMSKSKKAKIIAICVISGIVALAITFAAMFFSSSAYGVYRDMNSDNFDDALTEYRSEVKDSFIQETLLNMLLKDRVSDVSAEYENGEIDFDTVVAELGALSEMKFDGAKDKRTEIMASYAENIVFQYENGEVTYDNAVANLRIIKEDGYTEADSLINKITASNNAVNSMEKADEYYENGDYEKAISEYSKVPESNENYEEAQKKLNQIYADYIKSTVETAKKHISSKNYKQAVQAVNTAYGILPNSVDTTDLDTVKEESLAAYKTEIANKVTDLTEDEKWSEAFAVIDEAIDFDDNEYFQNLNTSTENAYVKSISATVKKHLDNEDYISAKRVTENALTVLPNNVELKELKKDVEDSSPIYLLDVCEPYASKNCAIYTNGQTISMGGKTYTNAFAFEPPANTVNKECSANFNVEGKYTSLSFMVGHVDNTSLDDDMTFQILCDGVLMKQITIANNAIPQKISIDITGVSQIQIITALRWSQYGFGNVTVSKNKSVELEEKQPVSLSTLTPINIGNDWNSELIPEWNKGTPTDPFGNSYADAINFIIFSGGTNDYVTEHYAEYRLHGKFSTITGTLVSHENIPELGHSNIKVYADDKLVYTSQLIERKTDPQDFSVDVGGADYVKIVIVVDKGDEIGAHNTPKNCLIMMDVQLWAD